MLPVIIQAYAIVFLLATAAVYSDSASTVLVHVVERLDPFQTFFFVGDLDSAKLPKEPNTYLMMSFRSLPFTAENAANKRCFMTPSSGGLQVTSGWNESLESTAFCADPALEVNWNSMNPKSIVVASTTVRGIQQQLAQSTKSFNSENQLITENRWRGWDQLLSFRVSQVMEWQKLPSDTLVTKLEFVRADNQQAAKPLCSSGTWDKFTLEITGNFSVSQGGSSSLFLCVTRTKAHIEDVFAGVMRDGFMSEIDETSRKDNVPSCLKGASAASDQFGKDVELPLFPDTTNRLLCFTKTWLYNGSADSFATIAYISDDSNTGKRVSASWTEPGKWKLPGTLLPTGTDLATVNAFGA